MHWKVYNEFWGDEWNKNLPQVFRVSKIANKLFGFFSQSCYDYYRCVQWQKQINSGSIFFHKIVVSVVWGFPQQNTFRTD